METGISFLSVFDTRLKTETAEVKSLHEAENRLIITYLIQEKKLVEKNVFDIENLDFVTKVKMNNSFNKFLVVKTSNIMIKLPYNHLILMFISKKRGLFVS